MKKGRILRLLLVAGIVSAVISSPAPAGAHDASTWYPVWWHSGDLTNNKVTWSFSPGFWNGQAYRDRVIEAAQGWNSINGNRSFDRTADSNQDPDNVTDCSASLGNSKIWKGGLAGSTTYAITGACLKADGVSIKTFQMKFDEDFNWYTGTGVPSTNQLDLWSGAAHEFGHAMGQFGGPYAMGHWDEAGSPNTGLCDYSDYPTHVMCYKLDPGKISNYPKLHDKHTFNDRY